MISFLGDEWHACNFPYTGRNSNAVVSERVEKCKPHRAIFPSSYRCAFTLRFRCRMDTTLFSHTPLHAMTPWLSDADHVTIYG